MKTNNVLKIQWGKYSGWISAQIQLHFLLSPIFIKGSLISEGPTSQKNENMKTFK
jgi:hypothetical protein